MQETPHVIDQKRSDDPTLRSGDLPDWDLGLNLNLPEPGEEIPGWFSDIVAIAEFLASLTGQFRREFTIGIVDTQTGIGEDLHHIESADPRLDFLRAMIGAGDIE